MQSPSTTGSVDDLQDAHSRHCILDVAPQSADPSENVRMASTTQAEASLQAETCGHDLESEDTVELAIQNATHSSFPLMSSNGEALGNNSSEQQLAPPSADDSSMRVLDISPEPPRQIDCPICFSSIESNDRMDLTCGHSFCSSCLSAMVQTLVTDRQTTFRCPALTEGTIACKEEIPSASLERLMDDATLLKFNRFKTLDSNPNLRECPKCGSISLGDPAHATMTCPK